MVDMKKCFFCKKYINVNSSKKNFVMVKENPLTYAHCDCYISHNTNKKRAPLTVEQCLENINTLNKRYKQLMKLKEEKITLLKFISQQYMISYLSKSFLLKMESIFNGSYKGLTKPIPPSDLLDMWQLKMNTLNRINEKNRQMGKPIDGINRISYDLAILLSKYDRYLKWKQSQQNALQETSENTEYQANQINYDYINKPVHNIKKEETDIDISSILDDI